MMETVQMAWIRSHRRMEVWSGLQWLLEVPSRDSGGDDALSYSNTLRLRSSFPFPTRATSPSPIFLFPSTMGRKLDPTKKEKRGPGRKARKQKGAETELARFLPTGKGQACFRIFQLLGVLSSVFITPSFFVSFCVYFLFKWAFFV